MARKKRRTRTIASTRITDDELIARLQDKHPHILDAKVSEGAFDFVVGELLKEPTSDENQHFFCRKCGEYHLKTHPHHRREASK